MPNDKELMTKVKVGTAQGMSDDIIAATLKISEEKVRELKARVLIEHPYQSDEAVLVAIIDGYDDQLKTLSLMLSEQMKGEGEKDFTKMMDIIRTKDLIQDKKKVTLIALAKKVQERKYDVAGIKKKIEGIESKEKQVVECFKFLGLTSPAELENIKEGDKKFVAGICGVDLEFVNSQIQRSFKLVEGKGSLEKFMV